MTVLKSKLSGLYFKDFGLWVRNPSEAHLFKNEWAARQFAQAEHVEDVAPSDLHIDDTPMAA